jgi:predicted dithiol-disulfide oxidoreductase (DUF899 family)
VPVEKEYTFDTEDGTKTLAELFEGRSELLAYHVMFGPDWTAPCPGCSGLADHFNPTVPKLNERDVTMICMSHAPIEKLSAHKRRRAGHSRTSRPTTATSATRGWPRSRRLWAPTSPAT